MQMDIMLILLFIEDTMTHGIIAGFTNTQAQIGQSVTSEN